MKIKTLLLALLIVLSLALPNAAFGHSAVTSGRPIPDQSGAIPLDLPDGNAYLSPDGLHILLTSFINNKQSLCIYSPAGEQEACSDAPIDPDPWNIRWSPDSKWIALTEDFLYLGEEPDIWVMDAQAGKLTNLTDDQILQVLPTQIGAAQSLDVAPVWMPDSSQIVFLRIHGVPSSADPTEYETQVSVYGIVPTGGDPVQLGTLEYPGKVPVVPTNAFALSPDGKRIAYNLDMGQYGNPANGVWIADLDGKRPLQVLAMDGLHAMAFSADGHFLLALNGDLLGVMQVPRKDSSSLVVARDGGSPLALDSAHPSQWAAWSPSGTSLVYFVTDAQQSDENGVYVVDAPGQVGKQVYSGRFSPPVKQAGETSKRNLLYWASNNTVLVRDEDDKFMLLSLPSGE